MKVIGILGGMSWESTVSYYQALNQGVKARLGGLHSARLLLHSVDFAEVEALQHRGDWDALARLLVDAALGLQGAGAQGLLIATNTMHKLAPQLEAALEIPLLHIADAVGARLKADGVTRAGLLGTRFTMEQDFYHARLAARFGIELLVPEAEERQRVHDIIYRELCCGQIRPDSRQAYLDIMAKLQARGAQAVVLGCTEIPLLVQPQHTDIPLYDTAALHAAAALEWALA
ncbi:aspartate/glutamate racemase family protein [Pseudaeromonas paramecii]|uniref:Aspartate/glutamate racemase family protein n=1 Tax=Pseudaeromonas paramecii TaxID=2138166 RepID=A0ABP8PZY2_9GAMM